MKLYTVTIPAQTLTIEAYDEDHAIDKALERAHEEPQGIIEAHEVDELEEEHASSYETP